jgi:hypothetical protein
MSALGAIELDFLPSFRESVGVKIGLSGIETQNLYTTATRCEFDVIATATSI